MLWRKWKWHVSMHRVGGILLSDMRILLSTHVWGGRACLFHLMFFFFSIFKSLILTAEWVLGNPYLLLSGKIGMCCVHIVALLVTESPLKTHFDEVECPVATWIVTSLWLNFYKSGFHKVRPPSVVSWKPFHQIDPVATSSSICWLCELVSWSVF